MMLEPAHRAGDAPRTAPEQGSHDASARIAIRLQPPVAEAGRQAEREEWLRRRRLERQLHDGAALRISALTLQIGLMRHRVPVAEADLDAAVDALQDELHAILQELRDVAAKIYPPLLDQAGLGPALREVADRIGVPTQVHAPDERFGPAAEGAAYFAVTQCLDATDESAGPGCVAIDVGVRRDSDDLGNPVLVVEVVGVDTRHAEAMLAQVWRLGATIDVTRRAGIGTITARIPCE
jgi:signal transduction histidine kinase